jgi:hypothetical protein
MGAPRRAEPPCTLLQHKHHSYRSLTPTHSYYEYLCHRKWLTHHYKADGFCLQHSTYTSHFLSSAAYTVSYGRWALLTPSCQVMQLDLPLSQITTVIRRMAQSRVWHFCCHASDSTPMSIPQQFPVPISTVFFDTGIFSNRCKVPNIRYIFRSKHSGMWRSVVWQKCEDVSEKRTAYIFSFSSEVIVSYTELPYSPLSLSWLWSLVQLSFRLPPPVNFAKYGPL